jgi:hypothetical protein
MTKQLRWWPVSILLAGIHGGIVVLALTWMGSGGKTSISSGEVLLSMIGAAAAALSYLYFLGIIWIIEQRIPPLAPPPPS